MVLNGGDSGNLCGHCLCHVHLINNDLDFSWEMHRQEDFHKYRRGRNLTNSAPADTESEIKSDMINWFKSRQHITELAKQLDDLAKEQMNQTQRNLQVIADVEAVFKKVYPFNFTIKPFGSRVTGLTTKDSADLDLFIDTSGNGKNSMIDSLDVSKMYLQQASSFMKQKQSNIWQNIQEVLNCRTPILNLIHLKTEMNCDICVTNSFGNVNTQLMKMYMKTIPLFRPLILIIREWAVHCKMMETRNNINNYALSLLVLFYFQQKKNVPSVYDLEFDSNYRGPVIKINGYNCMDYSLVSFDWEGSQNDQLYDLLLSFFSYYEQFDFDNDVICPLLGKPVKKKKFSNKGSNLPTEMYSYAEKVKRGGEIFRINERAMHIQDPLDLAHNLTKSSSQDFLWSFVDHCKGSRKALETIK